MKLRNSTSDDRDITAKEATDKIVQTEIESKINFEFCMNVPLFVSCFSSIVCVVHIFICTYYRFKAIHAQYANLETFSLELKFINKNTSPYCSEQ